MFSKSVTFILTFFNLCGYHPELYAANIFSHIIFISHVLLVLYLSLHYLIGFQTWMDLKKMKVEMISDISEFFFALITQWIVIIEAYIQRKAQRTFWQVFVCIVQKYHQNKNLQLRNYVLKFVESTMFIILFFIYNLTILDKSETSWTFVLIILLNRQRIFYYLFYLELIQFELENVASEAKRLMKTSKIRHKRKQFKSHRFKYLRLYYQTIVELLNHINPIFGWSIFVTILCNLSVFVGDVNWLYQNGIAKSGRISFYFGSQLLSNTTKKNYRF